MKVFLLCTVCVQLALVPALAIDSLAAEARKSLARATDYLNSISTNGGFVGMYSLDLQKRYGEALYESASAHEIWVQPPAPPASARSFYAPTKPPATTAI